MIDVNIPIAFMAGVVSFFAPCVLPLIPAYVGYVAGVSLKDLEIQGYGTYLKKIIISSFFYVLGFSLVFILLGTAIAGFGGIFRRYDFLIQRVGGAIILLMGLEFAGILKIPFFAKEKKIELPTWVNNLGYLRSFLIGIVFGVSWSPCVGAILGSILSLAAISATFYKGTLLLLFYSLGISFPFILVSLTLASAPKYIKVLTKYSGKISLVAGIILSILGFLLLTNTYKYLDLWLFNTALRFGYPIK